MLNGSNYYKIVNLTMQMASNCKATLQQLTIHKNRISSVIVVWHFRFDIWIVIFCSILNKSIFVCDVWVWDVSVWICVGRPTSVLRKRSTASVFQDGCLVTNHLLFHYLQNAGVRAFPFRRNNQTSKNKFDVWYATIFSICVFHF